MDIIGRCGIGLANDTGGLLAEAELITMNNPRAFCHAPNRTLLSIKKMLRHAKSNDADNLFAELVRMARDRGVYEEREFVAHHRWLDGAWQWIRTWKVPRASLQLTVASGVLAATRSSK